MRKSHTVIFDLLDSTVLSTLSLKRCDFERKLLNIKLCVDFLYNIMFETFLILKRTGRNMIKNS